MYECVCVCVCVRGEREREWVRNREIESTVLYGLVKCDECVCKKQYGLIGQTELSNSTDERIT